MDGRINTGRGPEEIYLEQGGRGGSVGNPRLSLFSRDIERGGGNPNLQRYFQHMAAHPSVRNDDGDGSDGDRGRDSDSPLSVHSGGLHHDSDGPRGHGSGGEGESVSEDQAIGDSQQPNVPDGHWSSFAVPITQTPPARIREGTVLQVAEDSTTPEVMRNTLEVAIALENAVGHKLTDRVHNGLVDFSEPKEVAVIINYIQNVKSTQLKLDETVMKQKNTSRHLDILEKFSAILQRSQRQLSPLDLDD